MSFIEAFLATVFGVFYYGVFVYLFNESQDMWCYCINKSARVVGKILFLFSIAMMIFPIVYVVSNN